MIRPRQPRRGFGGTLRRLGALALGLILLLGIVSALWLKRTIDGSLPVRDGEVPVAGLSSAVRIERDRQGIPTIAAANRVDLARATGYLHAQERFFQMDLMRRKAAGELAELFGSAALPLDRANRIHGFRAVARRVVEQSSVEERPILDAYASGVNSGLSALRASPFEYLLLRSRPRPWKTEDSALVVLSMFLELQDGGARRESDLGVMADVLPEALFRFLTPEGTEWDAPLTGGPFTVPPIPGPEVFRFQRSSEEKEAEAPSFDRSLDACEHRSVSEVEELVLPARSGGRASLDEFAPGSNCWAVAGSRTSGGRAILANDMHLGLSIPNTWYRAVFSCTNAAPGGGSRQALPAVHVSGLTLPGAPAIVVGSNGRVAWGFTNSYIDSSDLVILENDPTDPGRYAAPGGPRSFDRRVESIRVKGDAEERLEVEDTVWGPVLDRDHLGRRRVLRWTAHEPDAVNFHLLQMETAGHVDQALDVAGRSGVPAQNVIVADASGRIGWTICGRIPRRVGFDGRLPSSWADGRRRWDGWLPSEDVPRVVDPPSGQLWTANARTVDGWRLDRLGDGGYVLGARATQIRDALLARPRLEERDMLEIQLDDRALFLDRWRLLLLDALAPGVVQVDPRRRELRPLVERWGGRAAVGSVGYRMVRAFRLALSRQVIGALTQACRKADERFDAAHLQQAEGPLWKLMEERPPHLLSPRYKDWQVQILAAVDEALDSVLKEGPRLAGRTWGERNAVRVRHPLAERSRCSRGGWTCRRAGCRETSTCLESRVRPSGPPSEWWSRRVTRRWESSTCPAVRAGILAPRTTATRRGPGRKGSRQRSCPDLRSTR